MTVKKGETAATMGVSVTPRGPGLVVAQLNGRLDLLSAADVKTRLAATVAEGQRRVVVDLTQVQFIDSSGLGALIGGLKVARQAGGDLRIACPGEQARMVLQLTTLDRILHPYGSVEEALAGF